MFFDNQVTLITGAAQGIGAAIAETFAREGATIILNDINCNKVKEITQYLNEKYNMDWSFHTYSLDNILSYNVPNPFLSQIEMEEGDHVQGSETEIPSEEKPVVLSGPFLVGPGLHSVPATGVMDMIPHC